MGPNFRKLYLERMGRYLHSVKSNDSIWGGRFDYEKIKEIYFLTLDPPSRLNRVVCNAFVLCCTQIHYFHVTVSRNCCSFHFSTMAYSVYPVKEDLHKPPILQLYPLKLSWVLKTIKTPNFAFFQNIVISTCMYSSDTARRNSKQLLTYISGRV